MIVKPPFEIPPVHRITRNMAKQATMEIVMPKRGMHVKKKDEPTLIYPHDSTKYDPIHVYDEDTLPIAQLFKVAKQPKLVEQYDPYTTFSYHNYKQMNDPIEPDTPPETQTHFSIPSYEGRGNDRVLKDIHQPAKKKQKPGTPKTPSIVVPGPSKKRCEEYEDSNVFVDESFVEVPLENKLRNMINKIKKME